MNNYSTEQLQKIVDDAPDSSAEFWHPANKNYIRNIDPEDLRLARHEPKKAHLIGHETTDDEMQWESNSAWVEYIDVLIKLSDIRAELLSRPQKGINVTLSAEIADIKGVDGSENPEFKVGDRVVLLTGALLSSWVHVITGLYPHSPNHVDINGQAIHKSKIRHATADEKAVGHRIDEPASSCGMTAVEIDQFGEDLRNKPYVDLPEFEQADCEACRASLGTIRDYMIVCPDCGNKRCPQALNHRYKCTGSNAVNQAGELKEPSQMMTRESLLPPLRNKPVTFLNDEQLSELTKDTDFSSVTHVQLKHKPDSITAQLDPAKCRVVDPTVYDAPFVNPSLSDEPWQNSDAMSESHRSPSCKCHEFPFDAELEVPAGLKHDQAKPRYSLIPDGSLSAVVGVLEYGATKYAPNNWRHVDNARERYYNASMRHVQAWWSGEQNDPETGLSHLAHAVCSLMLLMALEGEQGE